MPRGDPRRLREVEVLLGKAERSVDAAELLLRAGNVDFAASRAYYGASTWRKRCCSPRGSGPPGMDRSRNTADAFSEGRRFLGDTPYHLALKEEAE
jgi:hypothetical protein